MMSNGTCSRALSFVRLERSSALFLLLPLLLAVLGARSAHAEIQWQSHEAGAGKLGDIATIQIPEGYLFADQSQMNELNGLTGNLPNPNDMGALTPLSEPGKWLVFFTYEKSGHVKDDDKDALDADGMLKAFKENDEGANEVRREQGLDELHTEGWATPPFYDPATHNLTWAIRLSSKGVPIINHNIRLLGREGVMEVVLVTSPEQVDAAVAEFSPLLTKFQYVEGHRYADFRQGDRVAEYGLAGLVLGGGAVLAAKSGLLKVLAKNIKLIVLGIGGLATVFASRIKRLFGGKPSSDA